MIVYSANLWLNCPFDQVVNVTADWLSFKVKETPNSLKLRQPSATYIENGQHIYSERWDIDWPLLQSIEYKHPDNRIEGREWITEIGLRQIDPTSEVEATVMLRTNEKSSRVPQRIQPTRPLVVRKMLDQCSPAQRTPGRHLIDLDENNANELLQRIEFDYRQHPIVLLSPTVTGAYPVDPEELLFYLGGLADVVRITPSSDTYQIQDILGDRYAVWSGALNLIYPPVYDTYLEQHIVPLRHFPLQELEMMQASVEVVPQYELLSLITHRVNIPNSWQMISLSHVREQKRHHEFSIRKQSGDDKEWIATLEVENDELVEHIRALESDKEDLQHEIRRRESQIDALNDQVRQQKDKISRLEILLNVGGTPNITKQGDLRRAFLNALKGKPTLSESLHLLESLFPDRVVVLKGARNSARESEMFKHKDRAFELMLTLVTQYWQALVDGKGDYIARELFGEAFAAKEAEPTERNRRARNLRTFSYNGQEVYMEKHLRIGVKNSKADTLRIHFHWDSAAQKIVIGHCGEHLDHK